MQLFDCEMGRVVSLRDEPARIGHIVGLKNDAKGEVMVSVNFSDRDELDGPENHYPKSLITGWQRFTGRHLHPARTGRKL